MEISKTLGRKYKFDIFSPEDIESECFIISKELLDKYDGRAPLKNFLRVCLPRRLRNFKRNWMSQSNTKHKILGATSLEMEPASNECDILTRLEDTELREYLNHNIASELRPDFIRMCDGYSLSHHRKKLILEVVRKLLVEYE